MISQDLEVYKKLSNIGVFYDMPQYDETEEKPWYYEYCNWHTSSGCRAIKNYGKEDQYSVAIHWGELKEELFDSLEKKIFYIKGIFEDYSGYPLKENKIHFANSSSTVERVKKWIDEIAYANRKFFPIINHDMAYTVPICHTITLTKEIIDFIQSYEPKKTS